MEGAVCYCQETMPGGCSLCWYQEVAKGVGTRAEATDAMDLQCSNVVTLPDGYGEITVPTMSFNVIYILSHLYRHVFTEGIGLRQLIDYYFVLVKSEESDGVAA